MVSEIAIEQAVFRRPDGAAPSLLAQSAGFSDAWVSDAQRLVTGFGDRLAGVRCPQAVFALPLNRTHIAIVQVADEAGIEPPRAVSFRVLAIPRQAYLDYLGDPFAVSESVGALSSSRSDLPTLTMPAEPLPRRTVRQVQDVLKRVKQAALVEDRDPPTDREREDDAIEAAEGPALLGGAQVLVDGGKLVVQRPSPDTDLLRGLWTLLPTTTRNQLWPASFAFSNQLGFDVLIVPRLDGIPLAGYTTEDQAADYPTGRYELSLQTAAEADDQAELDALFGRRSFNDTWRLGLTLLVVLSIIVLAMRFLGPPPDRPAMTVQEHRELAGIAAGSIGVGDPWSALGLIQIGNQKVQKIRQAR